MDPAAAFAQALKQRRKALDLTQRQLAHRVGCAPVTIQRIEQGTLRPSAHIVHRLAAGLDLPPGEREQFVRLGRGGSTSDASPAPARSIGPPALPLPVPLTPLIGRAREVAAVCEMMADSAVRLLTITGPGGIGKTRLALQVAADLAADFSDGVVFVDLAPIADPDLVAASMAQALGVREVGGQFLPATLKHTLRDQHLLLVLDNVEQVVDAAPLIAELLQAAPRLKVLLTSRVVVGVYGEHLFDVPPLSHPEPDPLPPLADLSEYEAIRLFAERAQAMQPDFVVGGDNAALVAAICYRLEGLPLAIELAAARIRFFPLPILLARLDQRLPLLTGGSRTLPMRQQTLRATIDWSYNLLDAEEQRLFWRLSVFVGGWSLEAAAAICAVPVTRPDDVQQGICSLLDQHLLRQRAGRDGTPRFTMLETLREYALERLMASGEAERLRRLHATYYLRLAEDAEPQLRGPRRRYWLQRLSDERDNLRAVMAWSQLAPDGAALGLRVAASLWDFWVAYPSEGQGWLDAAQEQCSRTPSGSEAPRAKALLASGFLAAFVGQYARSNRLLEESLALYQKLGNRRGAAYALLYRGSNAGVQADYARASSLLEQSLTLLREHTDTYGIAYARLSLGDLALARGDLAGATAHFQESLTLSRALANPLWIGLATRSLARVAWMEDDESRAVALLEESLVWFGDIASPHVIGEVLVDRARIAQRQGDTARAATLYTEALARYRRHGSNHLMADCLDGLAGVAATLGQAERGARLCGAAAALREEFDLPLHPLAQADHDRAVAGARSQLDEASFAVEWAAGWAWSLEQAVEHALDHVE